jgi:hypothetical protein
VIQFQLWTFSQRSSHPNRKTRMIFEIADLLFAFIVTAVTILLRKLIRVAAAAARFGLGSHHGLNGH